MKHITFAEKSLLVGDEVATTLLDYAAAVAEAGKADTVDINAIGGDGNDVVATFLLDAGTVMMAETATTSVEEPDNSAAIEYMREQTEQLRSPARAIPFGQEQVDELQSSTLDNL